MRLQGGENRIKNIRGSCETPEGIESKHLILCVCIRKQAGDIWGQKPGEVVGGEGDGGAKWRIVSIEKKAMDHKLQILHVSFWHGNATTINWTLASYKELYVI